MPRAGKLGKNSRARRGGVRRKFDPDDEVDQDQEIVLPVNNEIEPDYIYDFEDPRNYAVAVVAVRGILNVSRVGRPVAVLFRNSNGDGVIFFYKRSNCYYRGFGFNRDERYEICVKSDERELPNATVLGYDGSYKDLGASILTGVVNIGFLSFVDTIQYMIRGRGLIGQDRLDWMSGLRLQQAPLIVMLPESIRFKWIFIKIRDGVLRYVVDEEHPGEDEEDEEIEEVEEVEEVEEIEEIEEVEEAEEVEGDFVTWWMESSIREWLHMSETSFERVTPAVPNPPPPVDEAYVYGIKDVQRSLEDCLWADNALEFHCLVDLLPITCLRKRRGQNGKREVLVRWNNTNENWQDVELMNRVYPFLDTTFRPQR